MWKPYQEIDFVKSIIYAKKMHTNLLKHITSLLLIEQILVLDSVFKNMSCVSCLQKTALSLLQHSNDNIVKKIISVIFEK